MSLLNLICGANNEKAETRESGHDKGCSNHHFDKSKPDNTVLKFKGESNITFVTVIRKITCMHEDCSASKTSTTRMYKKDVKLEEVLENVEKDAEEVFNIEY